MGVYEGASLQALGMEPTFGLGIRLIVPVVALGPVQRLLEQAGATQLSDDEYSILRVEAGLPAAGAELSEDYTPLEAGLAAAISEHQGLLHRPGGARPAGHL